MPLRKATVTLGWLIAGLVFCFVAFFLAVYFQQTLVGIEYAKICVSRGVVAVFDTRGKVRCITEVKP